MRVGCMVICLCLATHAGARAQGADADARERSPEAYTSLFGGERTDLTSSLELRGQLRAFYDAVGDVAVPAFGSPFTGSGALGEASGTLEYRYNSERLRAHATGAAAMLRQQRTNDNLPAYSASGVLERRIGRRVDIALTGSRRYVPFYGFLPFFETTAVRASDALNPVSGVSIARNTTDQVAMSASRHLTRRTSATADVSGGQWRFADGPSLDGRSWTAGGGITHELSRVLRLSVKYARGDVRYGRGGSAVVRRDTTSGGLDYADTLTFARRTSLAFNTSTAAIRDGGRTYYRLDGTATLSRVFGRTWHSSAGYSRTSDFAAGFTAPLLSDSVYGAASGRLARSVMWSARADVSTGTVGFDRGARFNARSATARVDVAMTSVIGLYADYGYYRYRVPAGGVRIDLPERFSRHRATAGISMWAPLVSEKKVPRDSR